ncbi:MAG: lysophospholipid acyltransferase family protein [Desulfosalsimonas sp.]|uniref:lysophospholipid acyltransferase family protein n=1 Tax=Desulfosalsimonas sp. TaxID=3073848 RepID=UPI003970CC89
MGINTKKLLYSKRFAYLVYRFIRIYSAGLRLRVINEAPWQQHVETGGKVLLCVWHQQFFSLIRPFKAYEKYRPGLMISRSRDGEMIAAVANYTGWQTVRGSSSRGGRTAMSQMIRHLQENRLGAHILDGPRGPAGVVKNGAVKIAMDSGARLVPVYVEADAKWIFNSWDRFFVPRPLSRVRIRFGDMLPQIPRTTDAAELEAWRKSLEDRMRPGLVR